MIKLLDLNLNATKSYCVAFTPKLYKLALPSLHINHLPISYTDFIKYLGYIFTSDNSDDAEMLRQMRLLYCRSNRLIRMFDKCSQNVLIELYRSFCTTFYCPYFWTQHKKATFSKLRVAYNNVYRKVFGLKRRSSASEMFVLNNISNFEALMRKSIFVFITRWSNSKKTLLLFAQSGDLGLLETLFGKSGQTSCSSRSRLFQFISFTILQILYTFALYVKHCFYIDKFSIGFVLEIKYLVSCIYS